MAKPRKRHSPSKTPKQPDQGHSAPGWAVTINPEEPVCLKPISPGLWRRDLKRLRDDFLSAQREHGPLRCPLFQTTTSNSDEQKPPSELYTGLIATNTASYHGPRQYMTEGGSPIYLEHPVVDVDGRPIVDSKGRGLACTLPATRMHSYFGSVGANECFGNLFRRAGRLLLGSPPQTIAWIPHDTLFARYDECRWVWTVFDLAWQGRHPSLSAMRQTWVWRSGKRSSIATDIVYYPYDLRQLRALKQLASGTACDFPEEWTERLPGYSFSELPDLFQASADLIDTLLESSTAEEATRCEKSAPSDSPTPAINVEKTMDATDLRVLRTLAQMARGFDLEMPPVDQMPREAMESMQPLTQRTEMFSRGGVTLSRKFLVESPHEGKQGRAQELSQAVHFLRWVPGLLLGIELAEMRDALKGALVVLADRGLITSDVMELALPVGKYFRRTFQGKCYSLAFRRLEGNVVVGNHAISVFDEAGLCQQDTVSRMQWYSLTPKGWELANAETHDGDQGHKGEDDLVRQRRTSRGRMKREVAEPLIADHLIRKPHDAAAEVGKAVGCSTGVVAESKAWKLNRERLRIARLQGADPKAVKLDEKSVSAVGGSSMKQLHDYRQQSERIDEAIDGKEQELFRRIGEYQQSHPGETPDQIARAVGCSAGDVERRQATLDKLVAEQAEGYLEDQDVEDQNTQRGTRRKWVEKKV